MSLRRCKRSVAALISLRAASAFGQTTVTGTSMAFRSTGSTSGSSVTLSAIGVRWEELMRECRTDVSSPVDPNGGISLNGYYGLYDVTINGKTYPLDLEKGVTNYALQVPEPTHLLIAAAISVLSLRRRRR